MRCFLALAVLVSAANCQEWFLQRRDANAEHVASKSFMSSFSFFQGTDGEMHKEVERTESAWVQGPDGQMHHNVHKSNSETVHGDAATTETHSTVSCHDGHCTQVVMQQATPSAAMHPMLSERLAHLPPCLRGMIERMTALRAAPEEEQESPVLLVSPEASPPPYFAHLPPRLQGLLAQMSSHLQARQKEISGLEQQGPPMFGDSQGMPEPIMIEVIPMAARPQPVAPPTFAEFQKQQQDISRASQMMLLRQVAACGALLFAASTLFYIAIVAALKCRRSDIAAREVRDLAEPLAPAPMTEVAHSMQAPATQVATSKAGAVPMYLSSLYTRASAKSEAASVRMYLSRLYTRITA